MLRLVFQQVVEYLSGRSETAMGAVELGDSYQDFSVFWPTAAQLTKNV